MISDAKNGKLDLILVKSISRFARNTVDCLQHIRELKSYGVEVFFEKDNLWSFDNNTKVILTMLATFAQEEARSISENVKWSVRKRFRDGVAIINHSRLLGYTKDKKGGNLVVVPEEAQIVKLIFNLYISGVGPAKIANQLIEMGAKTGAGKTEWRLSTITTILKNEKYMGDMLQQKTISVDYLSHTRVKNKNHAPTYYTENSHEAIIDRETFELAQRVRKNRVKVRIGEDKNLSKYCRTYPLTAMIICSECGRTLKRRYWNYGKPSQRIMQQCSSYIDGKANCNAKASRQDLIEATTIHMLNKVFLKNIDIMSTIQRVIKSTIKVDDVQGIIEKLTLKRDEKEIVLSNLIDTKVKTPDIP